MPYSLPVDDGHLLLGQVCWLLELGGLFRSFFSFDLGRSTLPNVNVTEHSLLFSCVNVCFDERRALHAVLTFTQTDVMVIYLQELVIKVTVGLLQTKQIQINLLHRNMYNTPMTQCFVGGEKREFSRIPVDALNFG